MNSFDAHCIFWFWFWQWPACGCRCVSELYLLSRRPQLCQAGCQVLGTLTQLHGCSLIRHRGNRWLGRGHHLATRLQGGKTKRPICLIKAIVRRLFDGDVLPRRVWELPRKLSVGTWHNKEQRLNCVLVLCENPAARLPLYNSHWGV